ncbi:MAG: MarR family transcriptional regulator [Syntrophobacteraceae bacterium]
MENLDLIHCVPERLAEEADLDQILQTVGAIRKWEERHGEVLDYIYRQQLIRLLTRRAPLDDLRALNDHLERMIHPRRLEAMRNVEKPYGDRWAAYKDILESRLASLRSDAPFEVLEMGHVKEILELIGSGRASKQSEIKQRLGLKSANLTRILNVMEANDLIERRSEGREKLIFPGPGFERVMPVRRSGEPRWGRCLTKDSSRL